MSNRFEKVFGSRIPKILIYLAIAMILSLIAMWLWQGGYWAVARYAGIVTSPLTPQGLSSVEFVLPGQPEFPTVPDTTTGPSEEDYSRFDYATAEDRLGSLQAEYDALEQKASDLRAFGDPSPHADKVTISRGRATETDVSHEYIVLSTQSSAEISLAGWSLQSQMSGTRVVLPLAASPFVHGMLNSLQPITLRAGESVIVTSGVSPVGVSFRENICTGYLAQLQEFEPSLSNACPRPKDALPLTAENLQRYGGECIDFVATLPQCQYPSQLPTDLSPACRAHLANTFSYNGCLSTFRTRVPFALDTWRAYLNSPVELWKNTHDVIRLLDAEGRTVDALVY